MQRHYFQFLNANHICIYRSQNLNIAPVIDNVTNLNENPAALRNEQPIDRIPPSNHDSVPQVRKISRFQVSHVKEIDDSVKLPNIAHGPDIMLETISPEQHQQQQQQQQRQAQVAQEFVAHNIQSIIDKSSPDTIDPKIQQSQPHITEVTIQPQMHQQDPSVIVQSQNFTQPPQSQPPQPQPQLIQSQVQQQTAPNYPLIEASHVINQHQALQASIAPSPQQPVPIPVPVSSMPSQMIPPQPQQQQQQQPTIVSQQQIK